MEKGKIISQEGKRSAAWKKFKEQLIKPRRLKRRDVLKRQKLKLARKRILRRSLINAGIDAKPELFSKWVFRATVFINVFIILFLVQRYVTYFKFISGAYVPFLLIAVWFGTFLLVFFLLWLALYLTFDVLSYRRTTGIEDVLPDFLLLASANIRAGMPIDRALWYAVRPRFGVLAKEIELAAKETMSGEDLEVALRKFADKYNSPTLRNTVSLLTEGINAGGEIGDLLHKISIGIQENKLIQKELAASVSAYAIFISVAALIIAPFMFALSSQLLTIIASVTETINLQDISGVSTFAFAGGGVGVSQSDFLKFAVTNLFFTSFISAMIVSIIRKGDIKSGLKYIPIFIVVSLTAFFVAFKLFSNVISGIF